MENRRFILAFDALPNGTHYGRYNGRRYVFTKSEFANSASHKLVAEELGGPDFISMNLYRLKTGDRISPCEMPEQKVVSFVQGLVVD